MVDFSVPVDQSENQGKTKRETNTETALENYGL